MSEVLKTRRLQMQLGLGIECMPIMPNLVNNGRYRMQVLASWGESNLVRYATVKEEPVLSIDDIVKLIKHQENAILAENKELWKKG